MARKAYTEEQKKEAANKVKEIGVTKASKELGISVGTLNSWTKEGEKKPVEKKVESKSKPKKTENKPKETKIDKLVAENAKLLAEKAELEAEVTRLKNAIKNLL